MKLADEYGIGVVMVDNAFHYRRIPPRPTRERQWREVVWLPEYRESRLFFDILVTERSMGRRICVVCCREGLCRIHKLHFDAGEDIFALCPVGGLLG